MILDSTKLAYVGNGSSLQLDAELCTGCGSCLDVCPHAVLALHERKAVVAARERCMECGACRLNCPFHAIDVTAGVGCVAAIVNGILGKGGTQCGCSTAVRPPKDCT
jgi:NAD-dependent dihydropyrimidine dehydrogenase PreA subunit